MNYEELYTALQPLTCGSQMHRAAEQAYQQEDPVAMAQEIADCAARKNTAVSAISLAEIVGKLTCKFDDKLEDIGYNRKGGSETETR